MVLKTSPASIPRSSREVRTAAAEASGSPVLANVRKPKATARKHRAIGPEARVANSPEQRHRRTKEQ